MGTTNLVMATDAIRPEVILVSAGHPRHAGATRAACQNTNIIIGC